MKERLLVCALVPYALGTTPSQRFRLEQWAPDLRAAGIDVDFVPFADASLMSSLHRPGHLFKKGWLILRASLRRLAAVKGLEHYDAVIVHRAALVAGPAFLERRIARALPLVFDFDDAIWLLHTTAANRRIGWLKFPGKTSEICRVSTQVVVGNDYLAEYARRHNSHVAVVPSSIDTDLFRAREWSEKAGPVVVGWTGSSTSQTHLEAFVPLLQELTRRPDVELRVHSDREPLLPGVRFVWRPWSPSTEAAELSAFDIGLMPMPDDLWAQGKCAMKALLYMSVGVPVVCSPIGTNREVIRHGENGYLADTPEEWMQTIDALVKDRELRRRIGLAGRATVEARYSRRRCAALFAEAVRAAVAAGNSAA